MLQEKYPKKTVIFLRYEPFNQENINTLATILYQCQFHINFQNLCFEKRRIPNTCYGIELRYSDATLLRNGDIVPG